MATFFRNILIFLHPLSLTICAIYLFSYVYLIEHDPVNEIVIYYYFRSTLGGYLSFIFWFFLLLSCYILSFEQYKPILKMTYLLKRCKLILLNLTLITSFIGFFEIIHYIPALDFFWWGLFLGIPLLNTLIFSYTYFKNKPKPYTRQKYKQRKESPKPPPHPNNQDQEDAFDPILITSDPYEFFNWICKKFYLTYKISKNSAFPKITYIWKRLMKFLHPDANPHIYEELTKRLNEAYQKIKAERGL